LLSRSLREHPRVWLLVLAPLFIAVETACSGPPASSSGQVQITKKQADDFLKRGDKTVKRMDARGVVAPYTKVLRGVRAQTAAGGSFVYGNYKGTIAQIVAPRGLESFGKSSFKAGFRAGYISNKSDAAKGAGTVLVKFSARGAGSLCLHLSWTTDNTQQKIKGKFSFLGGTGRAARLHDSGAFRGVQPVAFVPKGEMVLFGNPSIGSRRAVPRGCGTIKPPPPPKNLHASIVLQGWAASTGPPPANATLHPDQSTITDRTLCQKGGGLYMVAQYSGPSSGVFLSAGIFGPTSSVSRNINMRPGRIVVLIASRPKNGSYGIKASLEAKSGGTVEGNNTVISAGVQVAAGC
jgi:hypothetical protein